MFRSGARTGTQSKHDQYLDAARNIVQKKVGCLAALPHKFRAIIVRKKIG